MALIVDMLNYGECCLDPSHFMTSGKLRMYSFYLTGWHKPEICHMATRWSTVVGRGNGNRATLDNFRW